MDIEQMLELYFSSDEEGRGKIIEDMKSEYERLSTEYQELQNKNKALQDMNRTLITRSSTPIIILQTYLRTL